MTDLAELVKHRRLTLAGFALATLVILSGFNFGPTGNERSAFMLAGDLTWDAAQLAEEQMPPESHPVPLYIGPSWGDEGGNVLALSVLRELVARHDEVMADPDIAEHFQANYHWMVRTEVEGPWGMGETVRMVMNQQSPVSAQIGWNGSDFNSASEADLTDVLSRLFAIQMPDGSQPYAEFVAGLSQAEDGTWSGKAFFMFGRANLSSLYGPDGEYSKKPYSSKPYFEEWETAIDEIYMRSMADTGEDVHVWAYLALDSEVQNEVNQTLPLVGVIFGLMLAVLWMFFRDWRDVLAAGAGLGLLMVWMAGTQAWLGYPMTQISAMLPILLLALGVDFSFHGLHRWRAISGKEPESEEVRLSAAWTSIRELRPALGLATITTMIAFGTASFSTIPDLAEWGKMAVIFIFEAYLLLGIFTVVFRSGFKATSDDPNERLAERMRSLAGVQVRKPMPFLIVLLLLTGGALAIGQPDSNFDVHDYLDNDSRMIRSLDTAKIAFDDANTGEPGYILVESGDDGDLADFTTLAELDALMSDIRAKNWTYAGRSTVLDMLRWQIALVQEGGSGYQPTQIDAQTGLPSNIDETHMMLADIARNGTMDPHDSRHSVTSGGVAAMALIDDESGALVMLKLPIKVADAGDWVWMEEFKKDMDSLILTHLSTEDGEVATLTGPSYQRYVFVNAMTDSFQKSIYIAVVACLVVLFLVFRDIRLSLLTISPVIAVSVWLYAGMEVAGTSLNLVTLQVASLAIGLGLDYAIHVTQSIREQRKRRPDADMERWVRGMMGHTGTALAASGITDIIGFTVLLLSVMPMFTMFGKVMIAMVLLAQAACLFILPALLTKFGGLEKPESTVQS
jgi:predicted RND superfamily exporter protein